MVPGFMTREQKSGRGDPDALRTSDSSLRMFALRATARRVLSPANECARPRSCGTGSRATSGLLAHIVLLSLWLTKAERCGSPT